MLDQGIRKNNKKNRCSGNKRVGGCPLGLEVNSKETTDGVADGFNAGGIADRAISHILDLKLVVWFWI